MQTVVSFEPWTTNFRWHPGFGLGEEDQVFEPGSTDECLARLVIQGLSNRAIAVKLDIPEGTVKWRLHRLYKLVGARSRVDFALRARDLLEGP